MQRFNRLGLNVRRKIVREKMFCRLTSLALLFSCLIGVGWAQLRGPVNQFSVEWQNLPLADAIDRIKAVTHVPIFVDCRVDKNCRIHFTATNASVDDVLANLASSASLGVVRIGPLYYLGPRDTAERLSSLAAERRREVAVLTADMRGLLTERRRLLWPRLAEPRGLVTQLIADHGLRAAGSERIPHDLWAAGELPAMPLADQLTVLLAGFGLTYQVQPDRRSIEIVPVRWDAIVRRPPPRRQSRLSRQTAPGKQVFTLRVENQPLGKVLEQFGTRLGWKIDVDEAAIRAAGLSLDRLVSFNVENADQPELLEALLAPAGLAATPSGDRLRIAPKP